MVSGAWDRCDNISECSRKIFASISGDIFDLSISNPTNLKL
jgi:hypothetical protein